MTKTFITHLNMIQSKGHAVAQLGGALRIRFPMVSLEFFLDTILTAALWSWV